MHSKNFKELRRNKILRIFSFLFHKKIKVPNKWPTREVLHRLGFWSAKNIFLFLLIHRSRMLSISSISRCILFCHSVYTECVEPYVRVYRMMMCLCLFFPIMSPWRGRNYYHIVATDYDGAKFSYVFYVGCFVCFFQN